MTSEGGEGFAVWLTRIEGKMDISNLRHDQTDAWKVTVDNRLHTHANSISNLQAAEHQRKGFGKFVHWLGGGGVVALAAMVARHFGL